MLRRVTFFLGTLFLLLSLTGAVMAQAPEPEHSDPLWQAAYWNNMSLSGQPALQRVEPAIDHNWGVLSPHPGVIDSDQFSARWSRYLQLPAGRYQFSATSDDGVRVSVDGELLIDLWSDHSVRTVSAETILNADHHLVVMEYYENRGMAVARLTWSPVSEANGWRGEYYNNRSLSGQPDLVRQDARIDFDWGTGSPVPGIIGADDFSVRWTKRQQFPAGNYTFSVTTDDGVRLWVNEHLLIDAWQVQSLRTYSGAMYLSGDDVPLRMEYFEAQGQAVAHLEWGSGGPPPPPPQVGTIIVDNDDAGFQFGGKATNWERERIGYNGDMLWTRNNDQVRPAYNWARWYPRTAQGRHEVFVYIPSNHATSTQARYWISHRDGFTLRIVNQLAFSNEWVSLGTYTFRGTGSDFVSLADVTYEPYLSREVGFDAVKWVAR